MTPTLLLLGPGGVPFAAPDPGLVPDIGLTLAQRPGPAQILEAAVVLGGFPPGSYLAGQISISLPPV